MSEGEIEFAGPPNLRQIFVGQACEVEPPVDPVLEDLLARAPEELRIGTTVDPEADLFEVYGVDGMDLWMFVHGSAERHGAELKDEDLGADASIAGLAALINGKRAEAADELPPLPDDKELKRMVNDAGIKSLPRKMRARPNRSKRHKRKGHHDH